MSLILDITIFNLMGKNFLQKNAFKKAFLQN